MRQRDADAFLCGALTDDSSADHRPCRDHDAYHYTTANRYTYRLPNPHTHAYFDDHIHCHPYTHTYRFRDTYPFSHNDA